MAARSTGADRGRKSRIPWASTFSRSTGYTLPARSVALITAEMSEAFPPAGSLALEAASMEVDFTAVGPTVVGGIGDRTHPFMEFVENSRME